MHTGLNRTIAGLVPVIVILLGQDHLPNGSAVQPATMGVRSSIIAAPDYDRESIPPDPEDPYETLPKMRYRLNPAAPTAVIGTVGAPGSGLITVTWQQGWLGRGQFQGFLIQELPNGRSIAAAVSIRTATFTALSAGTYRFQVTARGQYGDSAPSPSGPLLLLPAPIPSRPTCGYLIDVNLSAQSLVASNCGSVYVSTLITSGMPALRTPTGSFAVFQKVRNVYFYSPWPSTSPYYYPPMFVAYGEEFAGGGYYMHTDPNEPAGAFGPGSQNGPYASHGCIHVPFGAMASLYAWAPYGTPVYIHY